MQSQFSTENLLKIKLLYHTKSKFYIVAVVYCNSNNINMYIDNSERKKKKM